MPGDLVLIIGALVTEDLAALVEVADRARIAFDENVLVIVADLVAQMTQHGAVGLTEVHTQRLTVGVQRLDQIDGDHAVGVPDHHPVAAGVTGEQIECQPSVSAPVRLDRQPDIDELVNQPPQRQRGGRQLFHRDGVVCLGLAADQRIGHASPLLATEFLFLRNQPIAAEAGCPRTRIPDLAVDDGRNRRGRDHGAARDMQSKLGGAIRAPLRLEWAKPEQTGQANARTNPSWHARRASSARFAKRKTGGTVDRVDDGHVLDGVLRVRLDRFAAQHRRGEGVELIGIGGASRETLGASAVGRSDREPIE